MDFKQFKLKYNYDMATPVMKQFLDIKFAHSSCLVLFRMGDFYELFYEDAITASSILGITLTKRGKTGNNIIAMCGVPYHSLDTYLNKLLQHSFKVAICEQLETPEEAKHRGGYKAVVKRNVTRIVTPGTIIEESLVDSRQPNYLMSIVIQKNNVAAALSYVDLSTSEIAVVFVPEAQIINELARIKPHEILIAEKHRGEQIIIAINATINTCISFQVDSFFALNKCRKHLLDFYHLQDISSIGELDDIQISSTGGLIEYISITQKDNLPTLPKPKILNYQKFMAIDVSTRRNLEICSKIDGSVRGSLFDCINCSITKGGSRLLYKYLSTPLTDVNEINDRLKLTQYFYNNLSLTDHLRTLLQEIGDLDRAISRLNMKKSTPTDLLSIKDTIKTAMDIWNLFAEQKYPGLPNNIVLLVNNLLGLNNLYNSINAAIKVDAPNITTQGGIINAEYNPEVKEFYNLIQNNNTAIEYLRDQYIKETGIDTLKISHNNILGLFIEITTRHTHKISNTNFIHKQTTLNSVRYTSTELQELEIKINNAKYQVISLEQKIYNNICQEVSKQQVALYKMSASLSLLDVYSNFAYIAYKNNYIMPEINQDLVFKIQGGRHPVIEKSLKQNRQTFIANNCDLSSATRVLLITGPNMVGKSTYLRQNAIIAILAHIGSFVPADYAKIGVVDKIFSRVGAGDDLNKGHSTFMLEMLETSSILAQSSDKSLIILDEVGRGTSTHDGVAIAWSVLEYVHDTIQARCLFATHYHELTEIEKCLSAVKNYTVAIDETQGEIMFLYKIIQGSCNKSYGVHVAKMAGLPDAVITRSRILLEKFEQKSNKLSNQIIEDTSSPTEVVRFSNPSSKDIKYNALLDTLSTIDPDPNTLSLLQAFKLLNKLKDIIRN